MTDFNPENYKRITTIGQIRELSEDDFVYRTRGEKEPILHSTRCGSVLYHAKRPDEKNHSAEESNGMPLDHYYHIPKDKLSEFAIHKKCYCVS